MNKQLVKEISREIIKHFELNETENNYQNLWDVAKAMIRGKLITLDANIRKEAGSKINHLRFLLGKLG